LTRYNDIICEVKKMWEDFKKFAFEGNVLDLAVAVIIGAAFGKIVSSLVEDIMMPLIGALFNGVDFSSLTFMVGSSPIAYGMFIQSVFDFLIIAGSIFIFIRFVLRKKDEEEEEEVDSQEQLLTEIRDLLKDK